MRISGQRTTSCPSERSLPASGSAWPGARVTTTRAMRLSSLRLRRARGPARRDRRRARRSIQRAVLVGDEGLEHLARRGTPRLVRDSRHRCPPRRHARPRRAAASRRRRAAATTCSSPTRTCSARAPWPASGSITSGSNRRPISEPRPRRSRPHAASTIASRPRSRELAQPRVDVAAHRLDGERRLERKQLRGAPHGCRADPHARLDRRCADERVARILPLRVCAD